MPSSLRRTKAAELIAGTATTSPAGPADAPASNCSAGGFYAPVTGGERPFVVTETNGTWGTAIEVPGSAALNAGNDGQVSSVSCTAAGRCGAVGSYLTSSRLSGAFVVSES